MENLNNLPYKLNGEKLPNTLEFPIDYSKVSLGIESGINGLEYKDGISLELIFNDESYIEIPFKGYWELMDELGLDFDNKDAIWKDGEIVGHLDQFTWTDYAHEIEDYLVRRGVIKMPCLLTEVFKGFNQTFTK